MVKTNTIFVFFLISYVKKLPASKKLLNFLFKKKGSTFL